MKEIILVGKSDYCKELIDVVELEGKYKILGIVDNKENIGSTVLGYRIIDCFENLENIFKTCRNAVISSTFCPTNSLRKDLYKKLKKIGFNLPTIASSLAYVSKHASIGESTIIMHRALINANAKIGKNCIINTDSVVEYNSVVEDNSYLPTKAVLHGNEVLKENVTMKDNL